MGLLFLFQSFSSPMQTFTLTLQLNIIDVYHFVDFLVNADRASDTSAANVFHSASLQDGNSCLHLLFNPYLYAAWNAL